MLQETESAESRRQFWDRQSRVRPALVTSRVLEEVTSGSSSEPENTGGSFIETLKAAFGAPTMVTIKGQRVRVSSPTLEVLENFLADAASMQTVVSQQEDIDPLEALGLFRPVVLGSLEFVGENGETLPEEPDAKWLKKLRAHELVPLAEAFTQVFNFAVLRKQMGKISGNGMRVGNRVSPARN